MQVPPCVVQHSCPARELRECFESRPKGEALQASNWNDSGWNAGAGVLRAKWILDGSFERRGRSFLGEQVMGNMYSTSKWVAKQLLARVVEQDLLSIQQKAFLGVASFQTVGCGE